MQQDEDEYVVFLGYKFAKGAFEQLKKWRNAVKTTKDEIEESLSSKKHAFKLSGDYESDLKKLDKLLESGKIKNLPYRKIRQGLLEGQREEFDSSVQGLLQRRLDSRNTIINRIASGKVTDKQMLSAYNMHLMKDIPVEGHIQSVEELIKSSENLKLQDQIRKEEEKQFKKREREERKKNQEEIKEFKKRTRIMRDLITSVFQLGSIGGISWIAGKIFRRGMRGLVEYGEESTNIQTNAMSLHTTPAGIQRISNWFTSKGIEGDRGINFLKQYASKTGQYYLPAEALLSKLIKEAKKPGADALAAEMNTGDATIFRMLRNYTGNLSSDLDRYNKYILTDSELERLEKVKNDLTEMWNKFMSILSKMTIGALDVITNFRSNIKTFLGQKDTEFRKIIEENRPSLESVGKNILLRREVEKDKYDFLKNLFSSSNQESKNITINNNFNISGNSPEKIANSVKNIFDDSNWINNLDILPQMVT